MLPKIIEITKIIEKIKEIKEIKIHLLHMGYGGLGAFIILFVVHLIAPSTYVATVDLTGIVHQLTILQAKEPIDTKELKNRMAYFGNVLEEKLIYVAKTHHVILIPRQAVIAGSRDYTDEVVIKFNKETGLNISLSKQG